jgi:hypothetical protein
LFFFSGVDLLNGCQEGLWVEESVQEGDLWNSDWVVFPEIKLGKSLDEVI